MEGTQNKLIFIFFVADSEEIQMHLFCLRNYQEL